MMTVGAVQGYHIDTDLLEGGSAVQQVFGDPEGSADEEAAIAIFYRIRITGQL